MTRRTTTGAALALAFALAAAGSAGEGQAQEAGTGLIEEGAMAPEIEMTGATRHGVLRDKVRLSDYRGQTVVLAFFFRVRTRG